MVRSAAHCVELMGPRDNIVTSFILYSVTLPGAPWNRWAWKGERPRPRPLSLRVRGRGFRVRLPGWRPPFAHVARDRKSTRLNSSHVRISYAVFCLKKKKNNKQFPQINKKKEKTKK